MDMQNNKPQLNWSDVKAESSWRIFKVMSELVEVLKS